MKILHVIPSIGPLRGGPSTIMRTIAHGCAQAGAEVDIATTDDNGLGRAAVPLGKPILENGVTYRYFPRQTSFYTFSWPLTRWLRRHVREYDLVHIHALFSYAAIPAAYWAKRHGIPYIVRPLGVLNRWGVANRRPMLKKISLSLIEKRILKGAATIHYTSEQERREAEELGVNQKYAIIPNPAEMPGLCGDSKHSEFRAKHPQLAGRFVILFLSRLDPKKGLDLLLPAFANLRALHPKAVLVVAGDGDPALVSRLKEQAELFGIAAQILWTGFLTGDDKWAALADADLFVLPSYSENFGLAVVEAMASRTPVVVTDQVAVHREISEAKAGLVVPCDREELTEAMAKLMANDEQRLAMGINGRRLAETKFSCEAVTERLLTVYRDVSHEVSKTLAVAVH